MFTTVAPPPKEVPIIVSRVQRPITRRYRDRYVV